MHQMGYQVPDSYNVCGWSSSFLDKLNQGVGFRIPVMLDTTGRVVWLASIHISTCRVVRRVVLIMLGVEESRTCVTRDAG